MSPPYPYRRVGSGSHGFSEDSAAAARLNFKSDPSRATQPAFNRHLEPVVETSLRCRHDSHAIRLTVALELPEPSRTNAEFQQEAEVEP